VSRTISPPFVAGEDARIGLAPVTLGWTTPARDTMFWPSANAQEKAKKFGLQPDQRIPGRLALTRGSLPVEVGPITHRPEMQSWGATAPTASPRSMQCSSGRRGTPPARSVRIDDPASARCRATLGPRHSASEGIVEGAAAGTPDPVCWDTLPADYLETGFDLVAFFDCLHDMGDPDGAAAHVRQSLKPDGVGRCARACALRPLRNHAQHGGTKAVFEMTYAGRLAMFAIRVSYPGGHSVWLTRRFPTVAWGLKKDALPFPTEADAARTIARLRPSGPVSIEPIAPEIAKPA
jgi:hypothetical protein